VSTTTVAEAIKDLLEAEWGLGAPIAAANIHFDVGWIDRQWIGFSDASPQIIVSGPMSSPIRFFGRELSSEDGLHMLSRGRYVVNIWLRIMAGSDGDVEEDYMELMREEVVRILNEKGCTVATPTDLTYVKPLDYGRGLHELYLTTRVLRFEISFFANWQT